MLTQHFDPYIDTYIATAESNITKYSVHCIILSFVCFCPVIQGLLDKANIQLFSCRLQLHFYIQH